MLVALLWVLMVSAVAAADEPVPRFKALPSDTLSPASARLLSAEERDFIAQLPVVRVAAPLPPYRPYEDVSPTHEVSGIHPEMLVTLGKAFGIRFEPVIFASWQEALTAVRERRVDVVMTAGTTPERLQFLEFTLGATPSSQVLFGRRGAALENLDNVRIAVERGYASADYLRREHPKARLIVMADTVAALQAVAVGQADAYLGNLLNVTDTLSRNGIQGVEALRPMGYGTGHFHFGVRKDWYLLAQIINKGIHALRPSTDTALAQVLPNVPPELASAPVLPLTPPQANALARHAVWKIGAVSGLAMLNDFDESGRHSGIAAEYTQQVARRLGVAVSVMPFDNVAQMLDALRRGHIDFVPFLTRTEKRAAEFSFSAPYIEMPYLLVTRSDHPLYWGLDSLVGKRLALAREHPVRELIAKKGLAITIVDADNGSHAMDLVARDEADAAVEVKLFANLRINADNDGRLRVSAAVAELPAAFHFAAAQGREALVPLIDLALTDIGEAERTRMLRRWVALDLQPGFPWKRWAPLIGVSSAALLVIVAGTIAWLLRLKREVRARRRSEEFLEDMAATVPGVVFRYTLNDDLSIRASYFSPATPAFFGATPAPKQSLLESLGPRIRPDHFKRAVEKNRRCLQTGERFRVTLPYLHPDGHERWLHAEAVQTRSPRGTRVWTGYVVDVSAEQELHQRLAREAAARNLLLATASHELRAPTNNLSLALQLISDEHLAAEQAQAVRVARRAAATLTQLLNDVLDAARFDAGPMKLRPHAFDLHELLQELAEAWRTAASAKGLTFTTEMAPDLPKSLVQDPLRLKQVLTNLLSNANKYTREGGIRFIVQRDAEGLAFVVQDSGMGIDEAAQRRLFTPYLTFESEAGAPVVPEGSTGLGLVVCRQIAELMGGRIEVASRRGEGSRFTLRLPLTATPESNPGSTAATSGQVLVCDDDDTTRLLVVQMLKLRGFSVLDTGDGAEALRLWRRGDVAALITDLDMPGMRGQDLIEAIRGAEDAADGTDPPKPAKPGAARRRTAVVVCSGNPVPTSAGAEPDETHEPRLRGHDAYLLKPVQVDTLASTLRELGV